MILPTYLSIKEAAIRIKQKSHEPVTPEWLLQHASEGKLQLFALVRNSVCVIVQPKNNTNHTADPEKLSPKEVIKILESAIKVVHPVGSRVPLADEWASRIIAEGSAYIREVSVGDVIYRLESNPVFHSDGRVIGWARPWEVRMDDLCFRSEEIDRLIETSTANQQPADHAEKQQEVGAGNSAAEILQHLRAEAANTARGVKREILEHWDGIAKTHGPDADAAKVARFLKNKRDSSEKAPTRKTVHNRLGELRAAKLIP